MNAVRRHKMRPRGDAADRRIAAGVGPSVLYACRPRRHDATDTRTTQRKGQVMFPLGLVVVLAMIASVLIALLLLRDARSDR